MTTTDEARYLRPGRLTRRVVNPVMRMLVRAGLQPFGAQELEVRGRVSGSLRRVPVNPVDLDGRRYLVAPRGNTEWVRNLRASGEGSLRGGRRSRAFLATEVADADKLPVLREYLRRFGREVGQFFEGIDAKATDDDLRRVAPGFPVFLVELG